LASARIIRELENEIKIFKQDNNSQFVLRLFSTYKILNDVICIQVYGTPVMTCRPSCFAVDWEGKNSAAGAQFFSSYEWKL
jgi:hypothetical protein